MEKVQEDSTLCSKIKIIDIPPKTVKTCKKTVDMAAVQSLKKKSSLDEWSIREKLCLASSVMRNGDQHWVSVSRAIKPFADLNNRSTDWFSQKNCARQYSDLLEKVETPKRTKRSSERVEVETPGELIVRKLTMERIEELKKILQNDQQRYKKINSDLEMVKNGHLDNQLKEIWSKIEQNEMQRLTQEASAKPIGTVDKPKKKTARHLNFGQSKCDSPKLASIKQESVVESLDVSAEMFQDVIQKITPISASSNNVSNVLPTSLNLNIVTSEVCKSIVLTPKQLVKISEVTTPITATPPIKATSERSLVKISEVSTIITETPSKTISSTLVPTSPLTGVSTLCKLLNSPIANSKNQSQSIVPAITSQPSTILKCVTPVELEKPLSIKIEPISPNKNVSTTPLPTSSNVKSEINLKVPKTEKTNVPMTKSIPVPKPKVIKENLELGPLIEITKEKTLAAQTISPLIKLSEKKLPQNEMANICNLPKPIATTKSEISEPKPTVVVEEKPPVMLKIVPKIPSASEIKTTNVIPKSKSVPVPELEITKQTVQVEPIAQINELNNNESTLSTISPIVETVMESVLPVMIKAKKPVTVLNVEIIKENELKSTNEIKVELPVIKENSSHKLPSILAVGTFSKNESVTTLSKNDTEPTGTKIIASEPIPTQLQISKENDKPNIEIKNELMKGKITPVTILPVIKPIENPLSEKEEICPKSKTESSSVLDSKIAKENIESKPLTGIDVISINEQPPKSTACPKDIKIPLVTQPIFAPELEAIKENLKPEAANKIAEQSKVGKSVSTESIKTVTESTTDLAVKKESNHAIKNKEKNEAKDISGSSSQPKINLAPSIEMLVNKNTTKLAIKATEEPVKKIESVLEAIKQPLPGEPEAASVRKQPSIQIKDQAGSQVNQQASESVKNQSGFKDITPPPSEQVTVVEQPEMATSIEKHPEVPSSKQVATLVKTPDSATTKQEASSVINQPNLKQSTTVVKKQDSSALKQPDLPTIKQADLPVMKQTNSPTKKQTIPAVKKQPDSPTRKQPTTPLKKQPDSPSLKQFDLTVLKQTDSPVLKQTNLPEIKQPVSAVKKQPDSPALKQSESPALKPPESPVIKQKDSPVVKQSNLPTRKSATKKQPDSPVVKQPDSPVVKQPDLKQPESPVIKQKDSPVAKQSNLSTRKSATKKNPDSPVVKQPDSPIIKQSDSPAIKQPDMTLTRKQSDSPVIKQPDSPARKQPTATLVELDSPVRKQSAKFQSASPASSESSKISDDSNIPIKKKVGRKKKRVRNFQRSKSKTLLEEEKPSYDILCTSSSISTITTSTAIISTTTSIVLTTTTSISTTSAPLTSPAATTSTLPMSSTVSASNKSKAITADLIQSNETTVTSTTTSITSNQSSILSELKSIGEEPSNDKEPTSSDEYLTIPDSDDMSNFDKTQSLSESDSINCSTSIFRDDNQRDYKSWKKAIMLVWRSAANHKFANVFLQPVTDEVAPGYHGIVHRPMDLYTLKKNIENGVIRTTAEFQRDVMLMFQNAIMYNNSDHDVHHMANEMQKEVIRTIQDFLATQLMLHTSEMRTLQIREHSSRRSDSCEKRLVFLTNEESTASSESFKILEKEEKEDNKRKSTETENTKSKKRRLEMSN